MDGQPSPRNEAQKLYDHIIRLRDQSGAGSKIITDAIGGSSIIKALKDGTRKKQIPLENLKRVEAIIRAAASDVSSFTMSDRDSRRLYRFNLELNPDKNLSDEDKAEMEKLAGYVDIRRILDLKAYEENPEDYRLPDEELLGALLASDADEWNRLKAELRLEDRDELLYLRGLNAKEKVLNGFDLSGCDLTGMTWPVHSHNAAPASLKDSELFDVSAPDAFYQYERFPQSVRRKYEEERPNFRPNQLNKTAPTSAKVTAPISTGPSVAEMEDKKRGAWVAEPRSGSTAKSESHIAFPEVKPLRETMKSLSNTLLIDMVTMLTQTIGKDLKWLAKEIDMSEQALRSDLQSGNLDDATLDRILGCMAPSRQRMLMRLSRDKVAKRTTAVSGVNTQTIGDDVQPKRDDMATATPDFDATGAALRGGDTPTPNDATVQKLAKALETNIPLIPTDQQYIDVETGEDLKTFVLRNISDASKGSDHGKIQWLADKMDRAPSGVSKTLNEGFKQRIDQTIGLFRGALQLDDTKTIDLMRANMVTLKRHEREAAKAHADAVPLSDGVEAAAHVDTLKAFMEKRYDALKTVYLRPDIGLTWLSNCTGIGSANASKSQMSGFADKHLYIVSQSLMLDDQRLSDRLQDGGRETFERLNAAAKSQAKVAGWADKTPKCDPMAQDENSWAIAV